MKTINSEVHVAPVVPGYAGLSAKKRNVTVTTSWTAGKKQKYGVKN